MYALCPKLFLAVSKIEPSITKKHLNKHFLVFFILYMSTTVQQVFPEEHKPHDLWLFEGCAESDGGWPVQALTERSNHTVKTLSTEMGPFSYIGSAC